MKIDDVNLQHDYKVMAEQKDRSPAEGGFVECLFELWKVRSRIVKARSEMRAMGQFSNYTHRFGDFIFQIQSSFNSSYISGLDLEQSKNLMREMKEKAAKLCYNFSITPASGITFTIGKEILDFGQCYNVSEHYQGTLHRSIFPADANCVRESRNEQSEPNHFLVVFRMWRYTSGESKSSL